MSTSSKRWLGEFVGANVKSLPLSIGGTIEEDRRQFQTWKAEGEELVQKVAACKRKVAAEKDNFEEAKEILEQSRAVVEQAEKDLASVKLKLAENKEKVAAREKDLIIRTASLSGELKLDVADLPAIREFVDMLLKFTEKLSEVYPVRDKYSTSKNYWTSFNRIQVLVDPRLNFWLKENNFMDVYRVLQRLKTDFRTGSMKIKPPTEDFEKHLIQWGFGMIITNSTGSYDQRVYEPFLSNKEHPGYHEMVTDYDTTRWGRVYV